MFKVFLCVSAPAHSRLCPKCALLALKWSREQGGASFYSRYNVLQYPHHSDIVPSRHSAISFVAASAARCLRESWFWGAELGPFPPTEAHRLLLSAPITAIE